MLPKLEPAAKTRLLRRLRGWASQGRGWRVEWGGGAGELVGLEWGAHLYMTLEFAATSEREAVRSRAE